jgi:phage recombination protein Bet
MEDKLIVYESDNGEVKLSPSIIRSYLVNGGGNVSDQEVVTFLNLCKYQRLNPFLREAYLIKFEGSPATIVTGKEVFTKRAMKNSYFDGMEAGVIVQKIDCSLENRVGTLVLNNEILVGGWAKVYRKDYKVPIETSVSMTEYCRYKKDGKPMASWANMPATMIRKVALVQALREAFPDDFVGLYSQEEMPIDNSVLEVKPIEIKEEVHQEMPQEQTEIG